jgi:enediyne biosynthesis protein E4
VRPANLLAFAWLLGSAAVPANYPQFKNIAREAGLDATFPNGGAQTKQFIIETTGSGIGLIDYDNDGLLDLFVLSGEGGTTRMYHNDGNDKFRDVTDKVGLRSNGWAQGVCAGDYDNDGYTDLFVTYWGQNRLYRNIHGKQFEEVTAAAHLQQDRTRYNTGCAFVDVDRDGKLDLFVANYLKFDPQTTPRPGANPYCYYRGIVVNCGPRGLPFDRNLLYRNNGDGTFNDISEASGIAEPFGHYSLGVLTGDFNNDGLPDIYVACDQTPSLLYINKGGSKFEEEAVLRGVAFDQNGKAMSGMGVAAGDYAATGTASIFRTNFSDEYETLYRNRGDGTFDDVSLAAGLGLNTRYVGWGTGFFDFNNDGWPDLFLVNGHAFPEVDTLHIDIHYKDRAILYQNMGDGRFRDISERAGPAVVEKHSSRGAAFGDINNDGMVEIAVNNQNETPSLLKPEAPAPGHWITVKLTGTRSNRSAIGARVKVTAGGHTQTQEVRSGGSYLSQSDLRLHFGLGEAAQADRVEIRWPNGGVQIMNKTAANRVIAIREE